MVKKLNEAAVKIDINGLESCDLGALAQMIELASRAEQSNSVENAGFNSNEVSMQVDDSGIGGLDPSSGVSMIEPMDNEVVSTEIVPENDYDQYEGQELGDIVGQDDISTEDGNTFDEGFDMDRMSALSGLTEDEDDDSMDSSSSNSNVPDGNTLDETRILPDMPMTEEEGDSTFGPFRSEDECKMNASMETNGTEGNNFNIIANPDGYYWKRTVQEEVINQPDPREVNTDGINNSVHDIQHKRTKLGDNGLLSNVSESEDDDDSVETIKESLNSRFAKLLGEK